MTLTAIILILISAVAHTVWNTIGKSKAPTPEFLLLANTLGCLCLSPVLFKYGHLMHTFTPTVWLLLLITGAFQAVYYTGVAKAYSSGDMSFVYPIMRSAPVLLVMAVNFSIGKLHEISGRAMFGILLVVMGGFILPLSPENGWDWRKFIHRSMLLALLAAVGTCGYSIIDDRSLRILIPLVEASNRTAVTLVYGLFEGVVASMWLALFVFLNSKSRKVFLQHLRDDAKPALFAGIGIYSAYCLVLVAMTCAKNVSYIVAFRQIGIPLAAVTGIIGLKEPCYPAKILGITVMLAGLVLVALK